MSFQARIACRWELPPSHWEQMRRTYGAGLLKVRGCPSGMAYEREFSKFEVRKSVPKGKSGRWRRRRGEEEEGVEIGRRERLLRLGGGRHSAKVVPCNLLSCALQDRHHIRKIT